MAKDRDRFADVVTYIEANLDEEIDLDKLCQHANLSKFHFHRQCSIYFGISVMALVRVLRLKRAAFRLAYRGDKIINIAIENGYESHEAFSRAFKKHFDKSPYEFRKKPDWTPWQTIYESVLTLRCKNMKVNSDCKVELIDFPETPIAALEHRGAPNLLVNTIQKFIQWRKFNHLPPRISKTFNLVYDDPSSTEPEGYRFDICCSTPHAIDANEYGVINKTIPAGKCAVVRHIGSDDTIGEVVNFLYSKWLENSCFELRNFPLFFERVSLFPDVPEGEMITDIYLPIA